VRQEGSAGPAWPAEPDHLAEGVSDALTRVRNRRDLHT